MSALIDPEELQRQRDAEPPVTIVDVRGADEYAAGHIPGALHLPADELPSRIGEIPRDRPVATY